MRTGLAQRAVQERRPSSPSLVCGEVHEERAAGTLSSSKAVAGPCKPAEIQRWVRYTAECYSDPHQFATPQDYLAALSECLDELCALAGVQPPRVEGAFA